MTHSLNILVADDDPVLRSLLRLQLEAEGHRVSLAEDGDEAMRVATTSPPELLVLDIAMPGTDGLEVTRMLRAQPATASLPIVLLTGRDSDHDIVVGWRSGASFYITKPFVIQQLRYFIRTMDETPTPTRHWVVEVD